MLYVNLPLFVFAGPGNDRLALYNKSLQKSLNPGTRPGSIQLDCFCFKVGLARYKLDTWHFAKDLKTTKFYFIHTHLFELNFSHQPESFLELKDVFLYPKIITLISDMNQLTFFTFSCSAFRQHQNMTLS